MKVAERACNHRDFNLFFSNGPIPRDKNLFVISDANSHSRRYGLFVSLNDLGLPTPRQEGCVALYVFNESEYVAYPVRQQNAGLTLSHESDNRRVGR